MKACTVSDDDVDRAGVIGGDLSGKTEVPFLVEGRGEEGFAAAADFQHSVKIAVLLASPRGELGAGSWRINLLSLSVDGSSGIHAFREDDRLNGNTSPMSNVAATRSAPPHARSASLLSILMGNNLAFTVRNSGESGTTVIGTIRNRTSRHGRPDRPALDELRLGEGLAAVVLAAGHIVCPAHDAAHHLLGVPADVGD